MSKRPIKAICLVTEYSGDEVTPILIQGNEYTVRDVEETVLETFVELEVENNDEVDGIITSLDDESLMFVYEGESHE